MDSAPKQVLLIEDNPDFVNLVKVFLKDEKDTKLTHLDSLGSALLHLEKRHVDVILLDLTLPDSDGLDGVNKIRRKWPDIPIVREPVRDRSR